MPRKSTAPSRKKAAAKRGKANKPLDRANATGAAKPTTKLDKLAALLERPEGATIADMMAVSGWQPHSVRGAIAGSLKKRGLAITSAKDDGERRYRCKPSRSVDARG